MGDKGEGPHAIMILSKNKEQHTRINDDRTGAELIVFQFI